MRSVPPTASESGSSPHMSSAQRLRDALRQTTRPLQRLRRDDQSIASTSGASSAMFSHIRNRLILWYIGILAAILLLLGILLYFAMQQTLFTQVNNDLMTNAQVLVRAWQVNFAQQDPKPICLDTGALGTIAEQLDAPYWSCFYASSPTSATSVFAQSSPPPQGPATSEQAISQALIIDPSLARAALTSSSGTASDRVNVYGLGTVQRYAEVVPGPNGVPLGIVQVAEPITGQLTALNTLRALLLLGGLLTILGATGGGIFLAQRALEPAYLAFERQQEFIADAAHELRTPLTLMRANAEVLLRGRDRLDPDDVLLIEDIVTESAHMGALANNLLTLARLDAGQHSVKRDVVDMKEIAEALVRRADALAEEHQVTLKINGSPQPALVLGDEMLLSEAALILVDNAIKYNKPGGEVVIQVEPGDEEVTLWVRDTGIGISVEHLAHLGERFYRPDKARSREMGGAGLGLSIARSIAAAHDGTLTLRSVLNQGTTAALILPAAHAVS
jgi:signal transduction histidine kinase